MKEKFKPDVFEGQITKIYHYSVNARDIDIYFEGDKFEKVVYDFFGFYTREQWKILQWINEKIYELEMANELGIGD